MLKTPHKLLFVLFALVSTFSFAQTTPDGILRQSNVGVQGIGPDGETMDTKVGKATLFLNESNGDLRVIFDLNTFSTGYKNVDSLLANELDHQLIFIGNIGQTIFNLNETKNNDKTYSVNGEIMFQNKRLQLTAVYDPVSLSGAYDGANDLKINFSLRLDPSLFYVTGFSEGGFSALNFEVAPGLVNTAR